MGIRDPTLLGIFGSLYRRERGFEYTSSPRREARRALRARAHLAGCSGGGIPLPGLVPSLQKALTGPCGRVGCRAAPHVCGVRLHLPNGEPGAGGPGHGDLS